MASFMRYASPFAEAEKPPAPAVLLLLQTDLGARTSQGLLIHEDLKHQVPSVKKAVLFAAPDVQHTYPPPPIFVVKIPAPKALTRHAIECHPEWQRAGRSERETAIIKKTVHDLVDQKLDTTKSLSYQDPDYVAKVFEQASIPRIACSPLLITIVQAAQMHPDLHEYEGHWATRCIVQARLKATATTANNKVNKEYVESAPMAGRRSTRKRNSVSQYTGGGKKYWSDLSLSLVYGLTGRRCGASRLDIVGEDHRIVTSSRSHDRVSAASLLVVDALVPKFPNVGHKYNNNVSITIT
ncbi:hypothetical protein C8R47DRAFT_1068893 [Mycena vitilis]|nr:hypothetical protein C8R47DRAFT_1068893 [Mycena vitilis]